MSTWELKEKSTGELKSTIEGEEWKSAQTKAFNKLVKNVQVNGFRKGEVPEKLAKSHIPTEQVLLEAVEQNANAILQKGIEEHDLWPVARPELKIDTINEDKCDLTFVVTVKPEVKLGQYKGLPYNVDLKEPTDKEMNDELTRLQENFAEMVNKEEAAIKGDTVVIDFEGFKDGVAFDGGKAENHSLELGSGSFIPGFEDQLIGTKAGEEKDVNVTFPEEYHEKSLAGAPVTFKVKVHEVKEKKLPEMDDDFAKDINAPGVETMDQLKDFIKNRLSENAKNTAETNAMNDLITKVVEGATVEIPQAMIDEETDQMVSEYGQQMQQQGFSLDQFLKMTGQKIEDLRSQMAKEASDKVKLRLVLEQISKEENLEANDEDIEKEFKNIADHYKMDLDKVKELISKDNLVYDVKIRKAYDLIKDSAVK